MFTDIKLSKAWPVLLACAFAIGLERYAINTFGWRNDVSWHVLNGLWMLGKHKIQLANTLTWTAHGAYWSDPEWLWDYLTGLTYHVNGWPLVSLFGTALFAVILGRITLQFIREGKPGAWSAILITLFAVSIAPFAEMRPQVASYLFFLLALQLLQKNEKKHLWLFSFFLPLWSNMHGSAVLWVGLLVLELTFNRKDWRHNQYPQLIAASIILLALRPGGITHWFDFLYQQTYASNFNTIVEWMSPNFHLLPFLLPLQTVGIGWVFILPKASTRDKAWMIIGTVSGLVASRFLPYALLIVMVLLPKYLPPMMPIRTPFPKIINQLLPVFWAALVVISIGYFVRKPFALPPENTAALYLNDHHAVEIVNQYDWGGTMECYGLSPIADGRNIWMIYPWWKEYLDTCRGQMPIGDFLKQEAPEINWVCWSPNTPIAWQMDRLSGWQRVYSDKWALVWQRVKCLPPS